MDQEDLRDLKTSQRMSKLINEDWEHAAYANDEVYAAERQHLMELEHQEWEHEQAKKKQKPAIIKLSKLNKDEATHNPRKVRGAHQEDS